MRRRLVLILLLLLPLQFVWSAAAAYCRHDADAGSGHVGHHQHLHGAQAQADGPRAPAPDGAPLDLLAGATDVDCCQCHGFCAGLPDRDLPVTPLQLAQGLPLAQTRAAPPPPPGRPERPQWLRLA